jgi:acyl dehydratase
MAAGILNLADVDRFVGRETGVSSWMEIAQEQIDAFADITEDHQWIHKNHPVAFNGPFGRPICHGLLVLAYAFKLAREAGSLPQSTWIIYGYDNLRFRAPVRSGKKIRCRTTVLNVRDLGKRILLTVRFKVEIESEKVPALVADCSLLCFNDSPTKPNTNPV